MVWVLVVKFITSYIILDIILPQIGSTAAGKQSFRGSVAARHIALIPWLSIRLGSSDT